MFRVGGPMDPDEVTVREGHLFLDDSAGSSLGAPSPPQSQLVERASLPSAEGSTRG